MRRDTPPSAIPARDPPPRPLENPSCHLPRCPPPQSVQIIARRPPGNASTSPPPPQEPPSPVLLRAKDTFVQLWGNIRKGTAYGRTGITVGGGKRESRVVSLASNWHRPGMKTRGNKVPRHAHRVGNVGGRVPCPAPGCGGRRYPHVREGLLMGFCILGWDLV